MTDKPMTATEILARQQEFDRVHLYGKRHTGRTAAIIGHGNGLGVLAALLSKGETLDALDERSEKTSLRDADFSAIEERYMALYADDWTHAYLPRDEKE